MNNLPFKFIVNEKLPPNSLMLIGGPVEPSEPATFTISPDGVVTLTLSISEAELKKKVAILYTTEFVIDENGLK